MRLFIIVQARMTSTRLPGKVLLEVLGKPLLEYQLERLKRTKRPIIVATTTNVCDDLIVSLCQKMNIATYRGDELDVLGRYYGAATAAHADAIIRITSDCPLIDPQLIEKVIRYYLEHDYAYVSNTLMRTYPRGMDIEIFSMDLLRQAHIYAKRDYQREHVTPFIYENFPVGHFKSSENHSYLRLTVDEEADYLLIKEILEDLYPRKPEFNLNDILELLKQKPELAQINEHVKQKEDQAWAQALVNK